MDGWNPGKAGATGTSNFDVWATFTSGGSLITRQIQGDGIDQHLAYVTSSNAYWYLTDRLGSTRATINNSGTVQDSIIYDAYGNITSQSNASAAPLYTYTGRELDVETGLQYNRARWYDPNTGRWISQDPLGFDAGDSNLYRYVHNQPTVDTDPSGVVALGGTGGASLDINSTVIIPWAPRLSIQASLGTGWFHDIGKNGLSFGGFFSFGVHLGIPFIPPGVVGIGFPGAPGILPPAIPIQLGGVLGIYGGGGAGPWVSNAGKAEDLSGPAWTGSLNLGDMGSLSWSGSIAPDLTWLAVGLPAKLGGGEGTSLTLYPTFTLAMTFLKFGLGMGQGGPLIQGLNLQLGQNGRRGGGRADGAAIALRDVPLNGALGVRVNQQINNWNNLDTWQKYSVYSVQKMNQFVGSVDESEIEKGRASLLMSILAVQRRLSRLGIENPVLLKWGRGVLNQYDRRARQVVDDAKQQFFDYMFAGGLRKSWEIGQRFGPQIFTVMNQIESVVGNLIGAN